MYLFEGKEQSMKKTTEEKLQEIIQNIEEIESLTRDMEYEDFKNKRKASYSVLFLLILIAETVRSLPRSFKSEHPEIPWAAVADMESVLTKAKRDVNLNIVWRTSRENIPKLKEQLQRILHR